jgi:hypothetical protein
VPRTLISSSLALRLATALATLLASVLPLAGCGGAQPARETVSLSVLFTAESDPGLPLAGVRVLVGGEDRGVTGEDGSLRTVIEDRDGARVAVAITCPDGHRPGRTTEDLVVRPFLTLSGADDHLRYPLQCTPTARRVAVLVRADGRADLPVMIAGREVARTDAAGAAQLVLAMAPGSAFRVSLDTSADPRLRPAEPTRTFTVGDRDEIVVFDQVFEQQRASRRARREPETVAVAPVVAAPEVTLPRRIESSDH